MEEIPPEEQYETDTIFSQEGDVPENYLQTKLNELDSDNDIFSDGENTEINHRTETFYHINLPSPTAVDSDSFKKLVEKSTLAWGDYPADEDQIDFSQSSGRGTARASCNSIDLNYKEKLLEIVEEEDENNHRVLETVTENENTHRITTKVTISLDGNKKEDVRSVFIEIYESQMPNYFEYRRPFPKMNNLWTLLLDQQHYSDVTQIESSICAALNSNLYMILCIGVDSNNDVTGVELSASAREAFRTNLTRTISRNFHPSHFTISPREGHSFELSSAIDVEFVPVYGDSHLATSISSTTRFLVVVRVKEHSENLYQLSSGRIYVEEKGRVVELSGIDEAFRKLIIDKSPGQKPSVGSVFMAEPESYIEETLFELEDCLDEESELFEEIDEESSSGVEEVAVQEIILPEKIESSSVITDKITTIKESIVSRLDTAHFQRFGWLLFASVVSFGIYKTMKQQS